MSQGEETNMDIVVLIILIIVGWYIEENQRRIVRNQKRIMDKLEIKYPSKDVCIAEDGKIRRWR